MELFEYILGSVFLLAGSFIVLANYVRKIANYRNRNSEDRSWSSPAPFIGPVFIILGHLTLPIEFSKWVFLAVIVDPDTVIVVLSISSLFKALREQ